MESISKIIHLQRLGGGVGVKKVGREKRVRYFRSRNGFTSIVSEKNAKSILALQLTIQEPNENKDV